MVVGGGPAWEASDSATCSGWTARDSLYPSFFSDCSVGGCCRSWRYTWGGGEGDELEGGEGGSVGAAHHIAAECCGAQPHKQQSVAF